MRQEILDLIIRTAGDLGEDELGKGHKLDDKTLLFGKGGALDSMGLVTLIVAVEQAIEDELGKTVSLADEKAMSQAKSPYRSVATLADYAAGQLSIG